MKKTKINDKCELRIKEYKGKANGFFLKMSDGITKVNLVIDIPEYKTLRNLAIIFTEAAEKYENRK